MGQRREIEAMAGRIQALEREVQRLSARNAVAERLLDDAQRLEELAEQAQRRSRTTTVAVDELRGLTVVRAGEFWGVRFSGGWDAKGNPSGFVCVFTPLF